MQILRRVEVSIGREDDIVVVRRTVREMAEKLGFDRFAIAAMTTATSELARNVWMHAGGGIAVLEEIHEGDRTGVRVEMRDQGPGIADVTRALAGGFSSAKSLGLGLSGSKRLVDRFEIESDVGKGTRVAIVKWARK